MALEEEGKDDVGLLEHLEAVDDQRVVVHEQGPELLGGQAEVPHLAVEEEVVLGVDVQPGVERDVHPLGARLPLAQLVVLEAEPLREPGELLGLLVPGPLTHGTACSRL